MYFLILLIVEWSVFSRGVRELFRRERGGNEKSLNLEAPWMCGSRGLRVQGLGIGYMTHTNQTLMLTLSHRVVGCVSRWCCHVVSKVQRLGSIIVEGSDDGLYSPLARRMSISSGIKSRMVFALYLLGLKQPKKKFASQESVASSRFRLTCLSVTPSVGSLVAWACFALLLGFRGAVGWGQATAPSPHVAVELHSGAGIAPAVRK